MSDIAIRVEGLSKQYRIGGKQERYKTLRDTLTDAIAAPFRQAGRLLRGQGTGAAELNETIWALKEIFCEVKHGEVVGIIGRNGAGKSTLLKILSRITEPTEGFAEIHGRVGSLIEVGTGFHPELTGRENIYLNGAILGMKRAEINKKFDEIVDFAEVAKFIDTPVKHYSSGMYLRLAFSVAAHLEPEILLVDEVLAVGDLAFQKKCLGKMGDVAREGRTVLFVSHNLAVILNLCSRVLLLNGGRIQSSGTTVEVVQEYLSGIRELDGTDHTTLAERVDRSGTGRIRATSFQAKACGSENGPPRTAVDAEFIVGYAAREQPWLSKLYTGITVLDSLGVNLFCASTAMKNSDFRNIPPRGQIICTIKGLPLIPGRYWVDISLKDHCGQADYVSRAASFSVIDGGDAGFAQFATQQWGSVVVPHEWAWKPGPLLPGDSIHAAQSQY